MCTVTFLPTKTGFVLTHNRDEAPGRSPEGISQEKIGSKNLIFPRDTQARGTWIAAAESGKIACLLNGAFVKHAHQPPYRRSRGLVLLDFFEFEQPDEFFENYLLDGIEPFTFLFFEKNLEKKRAIELRWDGLARHLKNLPTDAPHFWCSSTLYPPEMQAVRQQVFQNWLFEKNEKPPADLAHSILHLHKTGSVGDSENDFVMNRAGRVRTVSITQVVFSEEKIWMAYHDLLAGGGRSRAASINVVERRKVEAEVSPKDKTLVH